MKQSISSTLVLLVFGAAGTSVMAQEVGRVISSTPLIQQVAVPRQVCTSQPVVVSQPKSGAGAVIGALAGGGLGNAVGQGTGKALATVAGVVGGAILGDSIEGSNQQVQNVQQCSTQTFYENRATGYNVVYEYAGKQYTVQMASDPGPTVQLQVSPVGASPQPGQPQAGTMLEPQPGYITNDTTAYIQPQPVYQPTYVAPPVYAAPYYSAPYYAPYYAPIGLSFGFGYRGGYYGGHGGHGGHRR